MKNLQSYEDFLEENHYFLCDDRQLQIGDLVRSIDGFSSVIVSKEISNGRIFFRDDKGRLYIREIDQELGDKSLIDKRKKIKEDIITDPNRTVGTGTYTSAHSDINPHINGSFNSADSASGGSYPVYIS